CCGRLLSHETRKPQARKRKVRALLRSWEGLGSQLSSQGPTCATLSGAMEKVLRPRGPNQCPSAPKSLRSPGAPDSRSSVSISLLRAQGWCLETPKTSTRILSNARPEQTLSLRFVRDSAAKAAIRRALEERPRDHERGSSHDGRLAGFNISVVCGHHVDRIERTQSRKKGVGVSHHTMFIEIECGAALRCVHMQSQRLVLAIGTPRPERSAESSCLFFSLTASAMPVGRI
ncbi:hypothetical protein N431DRAFT_527168, partial [Stipitochalara longipes BDJ]